MTRPMQFTFIPLELGKPLPKAGVFAHYQAEAVAHKNPYPSDMEGYESRYV
jgi:hypothetical protein